MALPPRAGTDRDGVAPAMGSMMSDGRISTLLLAVGLVVALVAAMRFWQAWRSAHIRRPFI